MARVLAPGELLFRQGDRAGAIYKVETGRLRLIRRTIDDRLVILHTAITATPSPPCSPAFASIRKRSSSKRFARTRRLRKHSWRASPTSDRIRARLELRNIRSARDRVLQYLRLRAGIHGRSVTIEGQLQDVAAEIGITREALYRTLATLEAEEYLTRTENGIVLKKF